MCQVSVNIPESVLYDIGMNIKEATNFVRRAVALAYYKEQKVSVGYCAEIAEMSEEDFIKFLSENKISIFDFADTEEFMNEVNNA